MNIPVGGIQKKKHRLMFSHLLIFLNCCSLYRQYIVDARVDVNQFINTFINVLVTHSGLQPYFPMSCEKWTNIMVAVLGCGLSLCFFLFVTGRYINCINGIPNVFLKHCFWSLTVHLTTLINKYRLHFVSILFCSRYILYLFS